MKFHDFPGPGPKFHDFPGLESKLSNSMTFQVFQDRYKLCNASSGNIIAQAQNRQISRYGRLHLEKYMWTIRCFLVCYQMRHGFDGNLVKSCYISTIYTCMHVHKHIPAEMHITIPTHPLNHPSSGPTVRALMHKSAYIDRRLQTTTNTYL